MTARKTERTDSRKKPRGGKNTLRVKRRPRNGDGFGPENRNQKRRISFGHVIRHRKGDETAGSKGTETGNALAHKRE